MKLIPLTQGKFAKVDDDDFERLSKNKWCFNAGYAVRSNYSNGKQIGLIAMHRAVLRIVDDNLEPDHINHDGLDNQKENLRVATRSQNSMNRIGKRNGSSKYKGVSWHKVNRKWGVVFDKKWIGGFDTEIEAARAYDKAAKEKFGEYACLNNI